MTRDEALDHVAAHDPGGDAHMSDALAAMPPELAAEARAAIGKPGTSSWLWGDVWFRRQRRKAAA